MTGYGDNRPSTQARKPPGAIGIGIGQQRMVFAVFIAEFHAMLATYMNRVSIG